MSPIQHGYGYFTVKVSVEVLGDKTQGTVGWRVVSTTSDTFLDYCTKFWSNRRRCHCVGYLRRCTTRVNRRKSPVDEVPAFPTTTNPENATVITLTYEGNFIQENDSEESLGREDRVEET
jgi:hypothetical protein